MTRHHLLTRLGRATLLVTVLACEEEVVNGWPRGHAILQGSVLRRDAVPYEGPLFATCSGHGGLGFRTSSAGQYRVELSWSFPEGVPADSVECEVRAVLASFASSRRVLFVPQNVTAAPVTLDVIQQ